MPTILNQYYPLRSIVFCAGEGALIFFSMLSASRIYFGAGLFNLDFYLYCGQALLVMLVLQLCIYFFDLYDLSNDLPLANTVSRLSQSLGVGCIILAFIYYAFPVLMISSRVFWSGCLGISVLIISWRAIYHAILRKKMFVEDIVVLGSGKLALNILKEIHSRHDSAYRLLGVVGNIKPGDVTANIMIFDSLEDLRKSYAIEHLERIIVAPDDRRGTIPLETLLEIKLAGSTIETGISFYERITGKILAERVRPSWIIFSEGFTLTKWNYLVKRLTDILTSSILLVLSLPVMLISAIIIKLESPGPILYIQERVGEHGKTFKIIKFRSMCQDAEKNGAIWAKENDDRVTRFGSFIRKVRIDELPQLWNVLKGEMSLVGPRPERPVFVEELVRELPYYAIRHNVKPGVTGWAQVSYRYGASKKDALRKLEYDLHYIKNVSLAFDMLIIFYTIKTVLFKRGSR